MTRNEQRRIGKQRRRDARTQGEIAANVAAHGCGRPEHCPISTGEGVTLHIMFPGAPGVRS
jgi:hypothetical protein